MDRTSYPRASYISHVDVAISGARGLVGTALAASLRADGHRVLRLARGGITDGDAIGWDPEAGRIDAPALEGVDAVVHLAGEGIGDHRWTDEQKRRIRESRVRGTAVLAAAVASREDKPKVFVSASAIGYYGDRGDEVLTERSESGTDFLAELCRAWEAETQPAADAGVRTVIARTGIVLARHGGHTASSCIRPAKRSISISKILTLRLPQSAHSTSVGCAWMAQEGTGSLSSASAWRANDLLMFFRITRRFQSRRL